MVAGAIRSPYARIRSIFFHGNTLPPSSAPPHPALHHPTQLCTTPPSSAGLPPQGSLLIYTPTHREEPNHARFFFFFFSSNVQEQAHAPPPFFFPTQDLGSRLRHAMSCILLFSSQAILLRARSFSPWPTGMMRLLVPTKNILRKTFVFPTCVVP